MRRITLFLTLLLIAATAPAQQRLTGQTPGGALFTIEAPDDWAPGDDLLIYNHGIEVVEEPEEPDISLFGNVVVERGMAVAASSFSIGGWALFTSLEDNRELYQTFVSEFGEPGRVFVAGISMGALVTMQAVEQGGLGNLAGAYPICGPVAGSDVSDQILDIRLIYDVVCEGSNGELPPGTEEHPYALDPERNDGILGDMTADEIADAVSACTGIALPAFLRVGDQQQRLDRLIELTGVSEDSLPLLLGFATVVLSDVVHDEDKLDGRTSLGNEFVVYEDAELDASIRRVAEDPFDRLYFRRYYTTNGDVGDTRILVTHTDKDELVVPENQHTLLQRVDPAQIVAAVVVEEEAGHCAYSEAEFLAGFDVLVDWTDGAPQPDVQTIQDRCESILDEGEFEGPCRYDPSYEVAPLDTRIRPRNLLEEPVAGAMSGSFFVRGRGGQGWFVEILEGGRAVVYWFTYDPDGEPVWIGGTGDVVANGIAIDETWLGTGARFGADFDPAEVELVPWGSMDFVFTEDGIGEMRYDGPDAWGAGRDPIEQLTRIGAAACGAPQSSLSGLWFDADRIGEGLIFEVQADGRLFTAWFTYDVDGTPLWLYGEATEIDEAGVTIALSRFRGPLFGDAFDAADLESEPWGELVVTGDAPNRRSLAWDSVDPAFGSGTLDLTRLTRPEASPVCP